MGVAPKFPARVPGQSFSFPARSFTAEMVVDVLWLAIVSNNNVPMCHLNSKLSKEQRTKFPKMSTAMKVVTMPGHSPRHPGSGLWTASQCVD